MAGTASSPEKARKRVVTRTTKASAPSHRHTLRVPTVDTSVEEWWAAQDDASASVRTLIRDEIMKFGFTDTVNRPVTQLPRRGRPPGSGYEDTDGAEGTNSGYRDSDTESGVPTTSTAQPARAAKPVEPAVPAPVPVPVLTQRQVDLNESAAPAAPASAEPAQPVQADLEPDELPEATTSTESSPSGQMDMADIFGH